MTEVSNIWAEMMAQGQRMAKAFNPALENFQPQGFDKLWPTMPKEVMEMIWGNAFNPGGLDAKTRLLVVLAGMTVLGAQAEPAFKATVRHAAEAGADKKEIAEVIWQMSMLGGLPAMGRAMQMVEEVFAETSEEKDE
ncbi:carboxymuconolactone decarboxylase family protein [Frigidibacter sp. ROC022]|uniref:carboxymuconolactone decarboxylase family protein n=1 Tax=Frigidibacter sp. ROC022 TaxID=2971796 RepID=UPI00215B6F44|nr:carboxymuconolactone decarboxylase family protein [Frigidibacter sp. ROC022]MCR8723285.1 carboxymuconolactone decarboxylase family protein [Frigidibacter sp. ROC022]